MTTMRLAVHCGHASSLCEKGGRGFELSNFAGQLEARLRVDSHFLFFFTLSIPHNGASE